MEKTKPDCYNRFRAWRKENDRQSPIIALAAVYAAFFSAMSAPAASYNVTDLGTLGGFSSSDAMGINASGQVVGYAQTGSNAALRFSTLTER